MTDLTTTLREIQSLEGDASMMQLTGDADAVHSAVKTLTRRGLIEPYKRKAGVRLYRITDAGRAHLEAQNKPMGQMPGPRERISSACYVGERPTCFRAGAMDAFNLPSHGRPRVRPFILASSVSGAPLGR